MIRSTFLKTSSSTKNALNGVLALSLICGGLSQGQNDPEALNYKELSSEALFEGFQAPPAEAKPFVRWWWSSNRTNEAQIERELDLLDDAGIGGVEINPIQARGERGIKSAVEPLPWRSKKWDELVEHAGKEAHERGMIVDLLPGSGWPFGGEFLEPEQLIMRIGSVDRVVTGPKTVSFDWAELEKEMRAQVKHGTKGEVSLQTVKVYPTGIGALDQLKDITADVEVGEKLTVEVPEGEHIVTFRMFQNGYRFVTGGVQGAAGSSMDHYKAEVTKLYLERLKGIEKTWRKPMSTYIRAIFCDSIETAGANWTHGILDDFEKAMGYDIEPYLSFALSKNEDVVGQVSAAFNDKIRRARYDWSRFISDYFHQNFTKVLHNFCRENGLFSRYQAYGTPYLMDMAEGYMIPDIPESNNWIRVDQQEADSFKVDIAKGDMIWSKHASAGARLRNKRIASIEAMTITENNFERSLSDIKQADDVNFIVGITHTVLHGFNSVPEDIPFPGLIRFGTYFSEWNTWWPYVDRWFDYNARVSYVMQNTKPTSEIAIIGPTADVWSDRLLERGPFHQTPKYCHQLWRSISELGAGCDYVHEKAIQDATFEDGKLNYGLLSAEVLLVVDAQSMHAETVEAIQRFAESGGKVAFVDDVPSRSPGMLNAEEKEERIANAVSKILEAGAVKLAPPANTNELQNWTAAALKELGFEAPMKIASPREGLFSLRKKSGDADVIFITNTYQKESSRSRVDFDLGEKGLWKWNPETGERSPYDLPYDESGFEIDLRPIESILLFTGKKEAPVNARQVSGDEVESEVIASTWKVTFHPAQEEETFTEDYSELQDFTKSDNEKVRKFSGVAVYETSFELEDTNFAQLDLGWDNASISEVSLNGEVVGENWYGLRPYEIGSKLKKGTNKLQVKYTTTLNNKMNEKLRPSGLIGPVRLLREQ